MGIKCEFCESNEHFPEKFKEINVKSKTNSIFQQLYLHIFSHKQKMKK